MLSKSVAVLVAAATASLAKTPAGFVPVSMTDLFMNYGNIAAQNGAVVAKEAAAKAPQVGTLAKVTGTSFAVIMVDIDIPTNSPPATGTLLHWMQMGLTPAATPTTLNTTAGVQQVFLMAQGNMAAAAPYIGPNPPAAVPLSHRYVQVVVDTSSATAQQTNTLQMAAQIRQGFNVMTVLNSAGLADKVVAGNSFNVTNAGPAKNGMIGAGNATGTSSGAANSGGTASRSDVGMVAPSGGMVLGLLAACAVVLGL